MWQERTCVTAVFWGIGCSQNGAGGRCFQSPKGGDELDGDIWAPSGASERADVTENLFYGSQWLEETAEHLRPGFVAALTPCIGMCGCPKDGQTLCICSLEGLLQHGIWLHSL